MTTPPPVKEAATPVLAPCQLADAVTAHGLPATFPRQRESSDRSCRRTAEICLGPPAGGSRAALTQEGVQGLRRA